VTEGKGKGESWFRALMGIDAPGFKLKKNKISKFKLNVAGSGRKVFEGFWLMVGIYFRESHCLLYKESGVDLPSIKKFAALHDQIGS